MRLKRLTLHGYKTFASKTTFDFDEGLTAIVGPNGSGKSNIADAIRWVLGEQSYSTLRGKRTTDMIFAGSQHRPRAGMAQVILMLDNSEGWLPIEYGEIEISRRAYRSGENEYLVNGQRVRLRDVTELLASSGLSERTYTIIGQGLIDQALSLRSDERRMLFEEAAGVSHYKNRRAETLRRLQETDHNLERLQDILSEIGPRISILSRQANRAQNYNQLSADLRHHLRIFYGFQWKQSVQDEVERRRKLEATKSTWDIGRKKQQQAQERLDRERKTAADLESQILQKEEKRDSLRLELEKIHRDVAVMRERQQLLEKQLVEHDEILPTLESQSVTAQEELEIALGELRFSQGELDDKMAAFREFEITVKAQQKLFEDQRAVVDAMASQLKEIETKLGQSIGRFDLLNEQLNARRTALEDESTLSAANQELDRNQARLNKAQYALDVIQADFSALSARSQAKADEVNLLKRNMMGFEAELGQLNQQLAKTQARCELLDQLRLKKFAMPVDLTVLGRFYELVKIPVAYQQVVEAVLEERLSTWIVQDKHDLLGLLETQTDSDSFILALNHYQAPAPLALPVHPAAIGWLAELIEPAANVETLARLLLGYALLVSDKSDALAIGLEMPPGVTVATADGFVVHAGGLARQSRRGKQASILAQEEEWYKANGQLRKLEVEIAQTQARFDELNIVVEQAEQILNEMRVSESQLAKRQTSALQDFAETKRTLELAGQHKEHLIKQRKAAVEEISQLELRQTEIEVKIAALKHEEGQLSISLAKARTILTGLTVAEYQEQYSQLKQLVDSVKTIVAGRQAVVDSRRATLNQIDDQLDRRRGRKAELSNRIKQNQLQNYESALEMLQKEMGAFVEGLTPLKKQLSSTRLRLTQLEADLAAAHKLVHESESNYSQARIDHHQYQNQLDILRERIEADLGIVALAYEDDRPAQSPLPIAEVVEQLPEVDKLPDDIEETIRRYRGQLNRIGAINPDAPAEYEETKTRFEFLTAQVEDLYNTQKQLRAVIEDLDELTSRAFGETVEKTDRVFGNIFKRLFGGGSAQLVLTEPDDLTISGVDIIARLPRRREQGLALLSGGERSLTAAALIFALLKVSPTPFCVLDEVDAMLDEANITRFRELLHELGQQTQFIIITHNRGTVRAAESVYGVSMGSDSTSQVISIRPEDYIMERHSSAPSATNR